MAFCRLVMICAIRPPSLHAVLHKRLNRDVPSNATSQTSRLSYSLAVVLCAPSSHARNGCACHPQQAPRVLLNQDAGVGGTWATAAAVVREYQAERGLFWPLQPLAKPVFQMAVGKSRHGQPHPSSRCSSRAGFRLAAYSIDCPDIVAA